MRRQTEIVGRLKCRFVDDLPSGVAPRLLVVLCHGYGAPGTDLVPLAEELFDQNPGLREEVLFVFPEAPLSLEELGLPEGRAWWPIDMVRLQLAVSTGRFQEMQQDVPVGLQEARDQLLETLHELRARTGVDVRSTVLGGFSQGAMISVESGLHLNDNLAALIIYSGTLIHLSEWSERAPRHAGLKVLQSHGRQDPILPFALARSLEELLRSAGATVEFVPFGGGHQIPWDALQKTEALLQGLLNDARQNGTE